MKTNSEMDGKVKQRLMTFVGLFSVSLCLLFFLDTDVSEGWGEVLSLLISILYMVSVGGVVYTLGIKKKEKI